MLLLCLLFVLSLSKCSSALSGYQRSSDQTGAGDVIPGRYIVEFSNGGGIRARADPVEGFYNILSDRGISVTPRTNITSKMFFGTSFTTASDGDHVRAEIAALDSVERIWPVKWVPKAAPEVHKVGENLDPVWSSHTNTGVLDLHKQGILGEGITVAIVDTGIDYTHPALGGGRGPGFKVIEGTDIVGNNYRGSTFFPDSDPYDCDGHGTHVAGIVAGEDKNFVGVAPKAKLLAYKVFGCQYNGTGEDALIQAFVQAYHDGADVINASVGGPGGFRESAWATVASRIVQQGVFVAIAAGNDGDRGLFYGSSGATGVDVMSVASISNEQYFAFDAGVRASNGTRRHMGYLNGGAEGFKLVGAVPVYASSLDKRSRNDACMPLPDNTPDLSKYLVVVRRGGCQFSIKEKNLVDKNATYIWVYNTPDTPIVYPEIKGSVSKGFAMIAAQDGEFIIDALAGGGGNVTVEFLREPKVVRTNNTLDGGKISTFSSWGPSFEGQIKPEIAAPGGYIYSTFPLTQGGYAVQSGTSMASPYIAGIAALYMSKFGGGKKLGAAGVLELKSRIIASGTLVNWNNGSETDPTVLAPVPQQGAGYVNALKALTYTTSLSPSKLELNDTASFQGRHTITISNSGNKSVTYTLTHEAAGTVNAFNGSEVPDIFPPTFVNSAATLRFSPGTEITIPPHANGTFDVTISPPGGLNTTLLPVYSGRLVVTGNNAETLSIPYQGIHGKLRDVQIWDPENLPVIASNHTGKIIKKPTNVTLTGDDVIIAAFMNNFGTPELRWDIVERDYDPKLFAYPPVPGKAGFVGAVRMPLKKLDFPLRYQPRTDPLERFESYVWGGDLVNGSKITQGTYRFALRALRITGDRHRLEDWETVITEEVTIASPKPYGG